MFGGGVVTGLHGAHAVITGGSSGIGLATAAALGARGASVSLVARDESRLRKASVSLKSRGYAVRTAVADVSSQGEVGAAFSSLVEAAGPCDVLVTCAGQARPGEFLSLDDEVFRRMVEVDYFGTLHAVREVAPSMVRRRTGSIVAISSAAACWGSTGIRRTRRRSSRCGG